MLASTITPFSYKMIYHDSGSNYSCVFSRSARRICDWHDGEKYAFLYGKNNVTFKFCLAENSEVFHVVVTKRLCLSVEIEIKY